MPTYYEGAVGSVRTAVTREEYIEAWRLDQEQNGRMKKLEIKKLTVFLLLGLVLFAVLPLYARFFTTQLAPVALALACAGLNVYYGLYLPRWAAGTGGRCFDSNCLLGQPFEVQLYRDSYTVKSDVEQYTGHWTDNTACVESPRLFVLTGGWDRNLLILPKRSLTDQQVEQLREHFERTFVRRYVRRKS
ncbi:MAG: YcxB family protein [Clostridiales bacterium]|nr:YcxB family protein [Clostridiales bacterium]